MGQGETYFVSFALNPLTSDIKYISIPNLVPNRDTDWCSQNLYSSKNCL